jgi:RHS repeat-associated protein
MYAYRYQFNGKENDYDVKGDGDQLDYGNRIYDPRVGRFLSVDPITQKYPWLTPYQFASNTPIQAADIDGLEADFSKGKMKKHEYIPGIPVVFQLETFGTNVAAATNNAIVQDAEDVTNMFNSKGREQVILKVSNSFYNAYQFSQLPPDQQWQSLKTHFSDVGNVEDFLGGLAAGQIEGLGVGLFFKTSATLISKGVSFVNLYEGEKIVRSTIDDGVKIIVANSKDDRAYLKSMNAQALYMGGEGSGGSIIITSDATRSHILEEAIHHQQRMEHGDKYFYSHRNELEVEAQNKLLRIGKNEGWSEREMQEIQRAKGTWQKALKSEKKSN